MINKLLTRMGFKKNFKIQSFTFFIPSPPARSTGYREKQFDKIFYEFINKGYDILSLNTQASSRAEQSGMWIVLIVRARNAEAEKLCLDDTFHDSIKSKVSLKNTIDGLYFIDDLTEQDK